MRTFLIAIFYLGNNLRKGLKCLDYDESLSPMKTIGNTTVPPQVDLDIVSLKIKEINEYEDYAIFQFEYKNTWTDERLKWPSSCLQTKEGVPDFVKSELLDVLWNPITYLQDVANSKRPTCQNTLKIDEVIKDELKKRIEHQRDIFVDFIITYIST